MMGLKISWQAAVVGQKGVSNQMSQSGISLAYKPCLQQLHGTKLTICKGLRSGQH